MKPSWIMIAIGALTISGILTACSQGERKPAGPQEKVTLAIAATTDAVLAQVAQEKGYFREAGLDVIPLPQPYGKLALQDVLEGKAEFATVAETPVMFAILEGAKISVIATIQSSRKGNAIIARKDRGILTINDLKGKKVALTRGTTTDYFLDAMLSVNAIARNEVKAVDIKAEEIPEALANGKIDAASMFNTYASPARKRLGERGIRFHDENVYTATFNIVATQEFTRKNPGKVAKMLRALSRAEEFVEQNPSETQQIVARFCKIDIVMVRDIWDDTRFAIALDQSLLLALEDESRWAVKQKLTSATSQPNFLDYIYLDGLRDIKPDAVRILR
jgi:sulfonate transport system substrate-binding protein